MPSEIQLKSPGGFAIGFKKKIWARLEGFDR